MTSPDLAAPAAGVPRAGSNGIKALFRLVPMVVLTLSCLVAFLVQCLFVRDETRRRRLSMAYMRAWGLMMCRVVGLRLAVEGPLPPPGTALAPNHQGYVDIIVLGAVAPCFFVAKSDVARWPLFGWCTHVFGHVFVTRRRARDMIAAGAKVRLRLAEGHRVCMFLEGTSTGGGRVLPFRSPLLQYVIDAEAPVVPVAIRWTSDCAGVAPSEDVAYWKDHVFFPHLYRLLGLSGVRATIRFASARASTGAERKHLAEETRQGVVSLLEET